MDDLQPVVDIIKQRVADGYTVESLRTELLEKGYSEEQTAFILKDVFVSKKQKVGFKKRGVIWGGIFLFLLLTFATYANIKEGNLTESGFSDDSRPSSVDVNHSVDLASVHKVYESVFREGEGGSNPIGHYRFTGNSIYYYQNCSGPFSRWCKHKLDGVTLENFIPLSKDFAKITINGQVSIYQAQIDVTDKIANPTGFQALEKLESNPRYFSDGVYAYYLGTPRWEIGNDGIDDDSFPIKLSEGDDVKVPVVFQENYIPSRKPAKVLFLNNKVFLNGDRITNADAASFSRIENGCLPDRVGPWYKDVNNVYINGHTLVGADPATLVLHEYSNFNDQPRDADSCSTNVASDNINVYAPSISHSANCDNGDTFCKLHEVVPGVSPQDMTVRADRVILDGRVVSGEIYGSTITNNQGTFYLDGSTKTDEMEARVYLHKKWGKEYKEINARKRSYNIWYWIYSSECKTAAESGRSPMTITTEQKYRLLVNNKKIEELNRCQGSFIITLLSGTNLIQIVADDGDILYQREYEETEI